MPDYKGIEYLRNKLARKRSRVALRYKYYDMKYQTKDFGISTPPDLRMWMGVLGWCGRAVDALADRLTLQGFEHDVFNMSDLYAANNQDVLFDSAILGALISSCDFIYITTDSTGFPQMRVIDGQHATGIIDPTTNMLKRAMPCSSLTSTTCRRLRYTASLAQQLFMKKAASLTPYRTPRRIRF